MRNISHDAGKMQLAFEAALSGLRVEIANDRQKLQMFDKQVSDCDKEVGLQQGRKPRRICPREMPFRASCKYYCIRRAGGCMSTANRGLDCDTKPMCTYTDSREAHEKVESACSQLQTLAVIFREYTNAGILLENCVETIQIQIQTYQKLIQAQERKCYLYAATPPFLSSESCMYTKVRNFVPRPFRPQAFESPATSCVGGLNSILSCDKSHAYCPGAPGSFHRALFSPANTACPRRGFTFSTHRIHRTRWSRPTECPGLHVSFDESDVTHRSLLPSRRPASGFSHYGQRGCSRRGTGVGAEGIGPKETFQLEAARASTAPFMQERQECSTASHKTNSSLHHVHTDIHAMLVDLKTEMVQPGPPHPFDSEIHQDTSTPGLNKMHECNQNETGHSPAKCFETQKRNSCLEMKISPDLKKQRHAVHSRDHARKTLIERFILQDSVVTIKSLAVSPPTSLPFPISRSVSLAWRRFSFLNMFRCICCCNTPPSPH
jgi:hypothetical protein